jgi:hypothetical protein
MGACDERIIRASYEISEWDCSQGLRAKTKEAQLKLFEEEKKEGEKRDTLSDSKIEIENVIKK